VNRANGAVQKGMPHKVYHGKTGVVYNVSKTSCGVIVYKKVKHRYIEKRVNLRVEHISLSRSREEFVKRVKKNAELKKKAKEEGTHINLKRQPLMPREARTISMSDNVPETVVPIAYGMYFFISIENRKNIVVWRYGSVANLAMGIQSFPWLRSFLNENLLTLDFHRDDYLKHYHGVQRLSYLWRIKMGQVVLALLGMFELYLREMRAHVRQ
jgi:large subunit ribosomal protein L21e